MDGKSLNITEDYSKCIFKTKKSTKYDVRK
jgi:hypothetical protein